MFGRCGLAGHAVETAEYLDRTLGQHAPEFYCGTAADDCNLVIAELPAPADARLAASAFLARPCGLSCARR